VMFPIFLFSVGVTIAALWFNDYVVPKANLQAFSLLYDIRTKKATLNIKEGIFYNGLPNYSIKVNKKFPDNKTLKELIIYDHSEGNGNTQVILADSGRMTTINNERFLVLELFKGNNYQDQSPNGNRYNNRTDFTRNNFQRSKLVFDLSSYDLKRTDADLFKENRMMKNIKQLNHDIDSLGKEYVTTAKYLKPSLEQHFLYHLRKMPPGIDTLKGKWLDSLANLRYEERQRKEILNTALSQARNIRNFTDSTRQRREALMKDRSVYTVEKYRKYTQALACLIMFLIGAPLGSIIKKGGLGVPVLISIVFFIIFYVFSILGEKWSKEGVVEIPFGMWGANFILFWIGMLFLRQARNDSRLFEADVYIAAFSRFMNRLRKPRERELAGVE
jgi:lipopolysaccharide export system permease protein